MAKKRKTRQEKIILQLKRELARQKAEKSFSKPKVEISQEAISEPKTEAVPAKPTRKKLDKSIFFYHPSLVKRDLVKSLGLALLVISLEFMIYLRLR
jgi:hypothetical protein